MKQLVKDDVELLCDRGGRQIFSDEFLYDNDSKRVPGKVFQHEPKVRGEKLGTIQFSATEKHIHCPAKTRIYLTPYISDL